MGAGAGSGAGAETRAAGAGATAIAGATEGVAVAADDAMKTDASPAAAQSASTDISSAIFLPFANTICVLGVRPGCMRSTSSFSCSTVALPGKDTVNLDAWAPTN